MISMYVGVTDRELYEVLYEHECREVNFWTPGGRNFRAISQDDLFLFKLHAPDDYIVGGGYFVGFSMLPPVLAWRAFGIRNGAHSLKDLEDKIRKYRNKDGISADKTQIGCIMLTDAFYFPREEWIPIPENWSSRIVQGKTYTQVDPIGRNLYEQVAQRLGKELTDVLPGKRSTGEGAFQVQVADAYGRSCAITGEKTLPVLRAAHIQPDAEGGIHAPENGILLRSDLCSLYEDGYITITPDYEIRVSRKLLEDYGNDTDYLRLDRTEIGHLPDKFTMFPSRELLKWHMEHVFLD